MITTTGRERDLAAATLAAAVASDEQQRLRQIKKRLAYYHGEHPKQLPLDPTNPGDYDDNVAVNLCRVVVDAGVHALFGQDVELALDELDQEDENAAADAEQDWVDAWWRANGGLLLGQRLAINGATAGIAAYKLAPRGAKHDATLPRIIVLDPSNVTVRHDPDDFERVVGFVIAWTAQGADGKPVARRQLVDANEDAAGNVTSWSIVDQESPAGAVWVTLSEEAWPWPFPPVDFCQNLPNPNEVWGLSDLEEDVLALQDAVNRVASMAARSVRFYADPWVYASGTNPGALQKRPGVMPVFTDPDAKLAALDVRSDIAGSLDVLSRFRDALHEVSRVPEVTSGKLETAGASSGVALSILYGPLIAKTETKRRTYGAMLEEMVRRARVVAGRVEDGRCVQLGWPEIVPGDPIAEREALLLDGQIGASKETRLERLGYDAETELARSAAEGAAGVERARAAFDSGASDPGGDPYPAA